MRTKYPIPFCECGCGSFVTERKPGQWNRFLPGHNNRVRILSPEAEQNRREKISKTMKQLIANNPEMRESRRSSFLGKTHSRKTRKRLSEASVAREQKRRETGYQVPQHVREIAKKTHTGKIVAEETKQKISKANKGRQIPEETKTRISQTLKEHYTINENPFKGKQHNPESKEKISRALKGKFRGNKASNWRGGISSFPYGIEWANWLKEEIKERDENACQNPKCSKTKELLLDVHHIDYNKENNDKMNLITICKKCHGKTQHHREYWTRYYQRVMNKRLDRG